MITINKNADCDVSYYTIFRFGKILENLKADCDQSVLRYANGKYQWTKIVNHSTDVILTQ